MTRAVRVLSWNVERVPRARRDALERHLAAVDYDVAILTETRVGFAHDDHVLAPDAPPPGRHAADERKVAIWSRWGWRDSEPAPPGVLAERWVAGTTDTPAGPLRVIGICIPYRFLWVQHRPAGFEKRGVWEEHLRFLAAITAAVAPGSDPQVIGGDFNQRVPPNSRFDPRAVVAARESAMAGHQVLTAGVRGPDDRPLLCHVASTAAAAGPVTVIDRCAGDGRELSDHHGAVVPVSVRSRRRKEPRGRA